MLTSRAVPGRPRATAAGNGAFDLDLEERPALVRQIIAESAADHACPVPATVDYTIVGRPASWTATCVGTDSHNNFYGHGLLDAEAAVALAQAMV